MKIEVNQELNRELKNSENKLRRKIASKEREVAKLDTSYQKRKDEIRLEGNRVAIETRENNDQLLLKESNRYQDELTKYRDNIKKLHTDLELEKDNLRGNHNDNMMILNEQFQLDHENKIGEIETKMYKEKDWARDTIHEIERDFKRVTNAHRLETRKNVDRITTKNESVAKETEDNFQDVERNKIHNFEKKMRFLDGENRTNLEGQLHKHQRVQTEQQKSFQLKRDSARKHYAELTKTQQALFKQRLADMEKEHLALTDRIKQLYKEDIGTLVQAHSKIKTNLVKKANDNFYQMIKLNPKLIDQPKHYSVSMSIPEHEKDDVQIMAKERKIRISLSRRHTAKLKDIDGGVHKTKRSEVLTKEFTTNEILNPKEITTSYQNGILTYRISKK